MRIKRPHPAIFENLPHGLWQLVRLYETLLPIIGVKIFIKAGFVWDGGSIPRLFWRIAHPMEFVIAFLVHDALYRSKLVSRLYADRILFELIKLEEGNKFQRYAIYYAVRFCGWYAWNKHKRIAVCSARRAITLSFR